MARTRPRGHRPGRAPHTQIGNHGNRVPRGPLTPPVAPGVGGWPTPPPRIPNFLPMTPGFEATQRGANDALTGAEGQYAQGQIMTPAQIGLQKQRLTTDMGVATDRLKENLAERGVYTPWAAESTAQAPVRAQSPAGGGIGQALYSRSVATPFGRQFQDLGAQGAGQYSGLAQGMAGAELGYNQDIMQGLLQRASDAYQQQPYSLGLGGYDLPHQAAPQFPGAATGAGGRTRPRRHRPGGRRH